MKVPALIWLILAGYCVCNGPKVTLAASTSSSATAAASADSSPAAAEKVGPTNLEDEDDGSDSDPFRTKRQHESAGNLKSGLLSSIFNKKLGLIGSLSSISSSSKGAGVETHHHTYEYTAPPKPFDWWSFKKSILAQLLQAVKAITGGVIALNGQLVKVKGHIMAAKGHLLSTKGDSITSFGKHLATHAFSTHVEPAHADIHDGPSAPTGSGAGYGLTGPASFHSSLDPTYPHNDFKAAIEYPGGYYKESGAYSKRAAPEY